MMKVHLKVLCVCSCEEIKQDGRMRKESNDPLITTFGDVIKAHKYVSLSNYYLLGWFDYNCLIEHRLRKVVLKKIYPSSFPTVKCIKQPPKHAPLDSLSARDHHDSPPFHFRVLVVSSHLRHRPLLAVH